MSLLTVLGGAQHPTLTALSVTVQTGGSAGKLQNYSASAAVPHVGKLPPRALPIVVPPWEALPVDGSPLNNGLISGRHFIDAPTTDTNPVLDNSGLLLYGRHAAPIRGAINQTADSFNSYIKAGSIHRLLMETSGEPGGTNLLYNPTFSAGLNGWTAYNGGVFTWATDSEGGGRCTVSSPSGSASRTESQYQSVSVTSNAAMVLSAILNSNYAGSAGWYVQVTVQGVQTNTVLATLQFTSGQTLEPLAQSFNTGTNTQVDISVVLYNGATGGTAEAEFYKLQLEYGSQPSAYVDHDAAAGHNTLFTSRSAGVSSIPSLRASTVLNKYVPNSLANLLSDVGVAYSSTTSSVSIWIVNAAGNGLPSWTFPDGSASINPPASACGSSTAPYDGLNGMGSGQTAYFVVRYNIAGQTFTTIYKGTTPPTDAQQAQAVSDGSLIVVLASQNSSSGFIANGSGGTKPAGGGHQVL